MELKDLRREIDAIDAEMVKLFVQRMEVSAKIAAVKKEQNLPVFVPAREAEKLAEVAELAGCEMADYAQQLYGKIFELSKNYQLKQQEAP